MKRIILLIVITLVSSSAFAQEIVNVVLVGKNGITEDIKEAHSFIVIKKYPNSFQRLDYKRGAPLVRLRSYSDSSLKILDGPFYEYTTNGTLSNSGYYSNNLKTKSWYTYNDTGKVILEQKYEQDVLVKTIDPDTVKKKEEVPQAIQKVEKEAAFKKGDKGWIKYLSKAINADVGIKSVRGGKVRVGFTVSKSGKCVDVYLRKSVEFVLDEEAIRVIENSPLWEPAIQDGRIVNAYRIQPLTFVKE